MLNTSKPPDYNTLEKLGLDNMDSRGTHKITLHKSGNSSLGFSVVGLRSQNKGELGIFVQEIQPDGLAARSVPTVNSTQTFVYVM